MMTQDPNAPLARHEIREVMDLCLSCKGCKSECPSNVDAGKLKAEYLQHYYNHHGIPFRSWLTGNFARFSALGSYAPALFNLGSGQNAAGRLFRKVLGFAPERTLPRLAPENLRRWFAREGRHTQPEKPVSAVWFFADEFTLFNDVEAGKAAIRLLQELGYRVDIPGHPESGRAFLSKGMLKEARKLALRQLEALENKVSAGKPLLGLEPSAILTFADEYPDLLRGAEQERARELARHCLMADEFLAAEFEAGRIDRGRFTDEERTVRLHGHCHQKAMGKLAASKKILGIPKNYRVMLIPSGCCGMAGSFGYEAEHYALSMKIGELVLFPAIRHMAEDVLLAAPGTSCRHQIADGTGRLARHPVEILWQALRKP
jgi:Fe-S oxidoreductase